MALGAVQATEDAGWGGWEELAPTLEAQHAQQGGAPREEGGEEGGAEGVEGPEGEGEEPALEDGEAAETEEELLER